MRFPVGCDTSAERTEYCCIAQERLRKLHNVVGAWYREGIRESLWSRLPKRVQNRYPYKPQLSEAEWKDFWDKVFYPLSAKITEALDENRDAYFGQIKEQLKQSTRWEIDIEEL